MANDIFDAGVATLAFARKATLGMAEGIPEDKLCSPPMKGGNHAIWELGHIAWTDHYFMDVLGGKKPKTGESWAKLFGMGSTPSLNKNDYPPLTEIHEVLSAGREELISWFRSMSAEKLAAPLPADYEDFAPNHVGLMFSLAWHEGFHAGQLSVIRKDLGLKRQFG